MGYPNTIWKVIYLVSAVVVGVGCFWAFMFIVFDTEDDFLAAFGLVALPIVAILLLLFIGWFIYQSTSYIGPNIGIIVVAAILTMPVIEVGSAMISGIQKNRVKPYVESYMAELKTTFSENITKLDFDDKESISDTIRYWNGDIWVKLSKREGTQLSREDLKEVIDIIPPAKYAVRVFIYYGSEKYALNGQFKIDFSIRTNPNDPPYCYSDDIENKPCNIVKELLAR
ncbi:hypothetical protein [Paenibacillus sp. NPDC057967]|uniref:hypothetical protein n=1 Tax=Paenibacillus sp. NPDC057967 TaxID=3346293 RepID=UPI0036DBCD14